MVESATEDNQDGQRRTRTAPRKHVGCSWDSQEVQCRAKRDVGRHDQTLVGQTINVLMAANKERDVWQRKLGNS